MSGLQRNVASQKWRAFAFNKVTNEPVTGDAAQITAKIDKDWAGQVGTNDVNPTETEDGYYLFDLLQAETDANALDLYPESSTPNVQVVGVPGSVYTIPANWLLQYDGTGINGDTFPATQSQVSQIGSGGGSANNEFAILSPGGFVITNGANEVNNEDATRAALGDVHQIDDDGGGPAILDVYYIFEIGGSFSPNTIVFQGRMNGNNDDVGVYVNTNTQASPTWIQRATLEGSNSSVNLPHVWKLVNTDQMVGVDAGKVAVRFFASGLSSATLTTDQIAVEKTTIASVTGYQDGQIWVNTVSGTAGTVVNVNGVADKAVLTWADAVTISTNGDFANDFHAINGSTIALTGNSDNFSIFGDNWILQLAGRSVTGAYFQGARVSGICTAAEEVHFEGCEIATMSVQIGHYDFCSFSGTVTHTLAGDYNYHNSYSMVAGPNGPTFAKTAGQAITAQWRGWKGSINLTGLEVGDTLTIGGEELGTIDLGSPAGAVVVEIRGIYKALTNIGSAAVNLDGAILAADVEAILAKVNGVVDSNMTQIDGLTTNDGSAELLLNLLDVTTLAGNTVNIGAANITTLTVTTVVSALTNGITSFAQWLGLIAGKQTPDATALTEIKATGAGSGTYDATTDSQEAIKDLGDIAWITATGFNTTTPDAAGTAASLHATTDALVIARTILAAAYFDPATDAVANVTLVGTTTTNTDMVGTDNAALATVCTEARLAELDAANLPADVAAVKTDTAATLLDTGTDGVVVAAASKTGYELSTAGNNAAADAVLTRDASNVEDVAGEHSICGVILATMESSIAGTTLTIRKTGGTTFATKAVTVDASADPITGVT